MPDTQSPFRRRVTSWFAAVGVASGSAAVALSGGVPMSAQAQAVRPEAPRQVPAPAQSTNQPPVPATPGAEEAPGPAHPRVDTPPGQYGTTRIAGEPAALPRALAIEPSIGVTLVGDDNVNLTPTDRQRDLIVEISPRLGITSRGPRHRLNGMVGVDHTEYTRNARPSITRPAASLALESTWVDNAFYVDAGAQVERRAASPFGPQTTGVAGDDQVDTRVYRLSPRLAMHPGLRWNALVRSDNTWTNRSGTSVDDTSSRAYSRRTDAHFNRDPEPFGLGVEGSEESLHFGEDDREVLNLKSARFSLGYRVTSQFTAHLLAGRERTSFSGRVENDNDAGLRMRWAPLERSVLSVEARHRFFGNGFNAAWNHASRMFSLSLSGSREPVTQPEALRLAGNVGNQFASFYQAQGYAPAQIPALVQGSLDRVNLGAGVVQPVTEYITQPRLSTAANLTLTLAGRRTVMVLSIYGRRLEQLRRTGDAVDALLPGELDQNGTQFSIGYRLTPMVSIDTFLRYDHSESTGGLNDGDESTDTLLSASTSYWLSPRMRVSLGAQRHRFDSTTRPGGAAAANIGTFGVLYRF